MPARKTKSKQKEKKKVFQVEVKEVAPTEKVVRNQVEVKTIEPQEHAIDEDLPKTEEKKESEETPIRQVFDSEVQTRGAQGEQETEEPKEEEDEGGASFKKIIFWTLGILCAITLCVASGYFIYQEGVRRGEENVQEKASKAAPSVAPTPIPAEVKTSLYPIKVLNGSGISGEASTVKSLLEKNDYKVSSIGNADNSKYEETVIKVKKSVEKAWVTKLKEVLSKSYKLGSDEETLSDDESSDVIVIVGSKKAE